MQTYNSQSSREDATPSNGLCFSIIWYGINLIFFGTYLGIVLLYYQVEVSLQELWWRLVMF